MKWKTVFDFIEKLQLQEARDFTNSSPVIGYAVYVCESVMTTIAALNTTYNHAKRTP